MLRVTPKHRSGKALVIAALCLMAVDVLAVERQRVNDIKPLLLTAIDRGTAHGVLVGGGAEYIAQHLKSTAPIEIDVKTVATLREAGCKRLAVTTRQDGVLDFNRQTRATVPERREFTYEISYCRDGRIPEGGTQK